MSQLSRRFFAATAVSLLCGVGGAVQFAAGRDLSGSAQTVPGTPEASINRAAKSDRAARVAGAAMQTRTVSLPLYGLSDTSVLVRIPVAWEARNGPSIPLVTNPGDRHSAARTLPLPPHPLVPLLTDIPHP